MRDTFYTKIPVHERLATRINQISKMKFTKTAFLINIILVLKRNGGKHF
jgi:hypothetical protein